MLTYQINPNSRIFKAFKSSWWLVQWGNFGVVYSSSPLDSEQCSQPAYHFQFIPIYPPRPSGKALQTFNECGLPHIPSLSKWREKSLHSQNASQVLGKVLRRSLRYKGNGKSVIRSVIKPLVKGTRSRERKLVFLVFSAMKEHSHLLFKACKTFGFNNHSDYNRAMSSCNLRQGHCCS